ncbi:Zn(2)-C6 fungal-type domain-containing protein [Fusarium falciforme]|uniref:Zn(2)-C6 fungal-type domain-containing protein n=1 Tax=Fusarium falciforme TaxID=195108 RepID=UPI0023017317|nr:Zn(2)-C6 fungal-type domain-containing protein [Fusarium falciforme]WAO91728.1 Zn(2)-C6 fungal-type domain-containing protein [Fusarium falciforme]
MESNRVRKPRQGHRKSRNGCAICKKRHIKCDERRPVCGHCEISERDCYYIVPKKAKMGASPYEKELTTSAWLETASTSRDPELPASPNLHDIESDELFTFEHLQLLYNIQEHMTNWMMVPDLLKPLANGYVNAALKTPYLMNQLLALSAMHLSTVNPESSSHYTSTANHLRHRALRGFNKELDDTSQSNATSQFFFASLLALHYFAETISGVPEQEFPTTLRHMLEYFRLHRGARVLSDRAHPTLMGSSVVGWLITAVEESKKETHTPSESCAILATMLQASDLNEESLEACEGARESLDLVHRWIQGPNGWGVHALLGWSNLIPLRFLSLLEKQTPEALVILAHYAMLMHRFRGFWCFGEVGKRLVNGISGLLATYWVDWLPTLNDE